MRDKIRNELFFTHACRDFWWRSIGANARRERIVEVFNSHSGYFGISIYAHCQCYVIGVLKLFDGNDKSITLEALLKHVRDNPNVEGVPVVEIERKLKSADLVAKRLKKIRHKYMAHLSSEILDFNFYKEAGLSHNEMNALWDQSWSIFEALSYHVDKSVETPLQDNVQVFDDLIDALASASPLALSYDEKA